MNNINKNTNTINSNNQSITITNCIRCGSDKLWKYGKEPKSGLQKYKCKICKKQFTQESNPNFTKNQTKYGLCPLCKSSLEVRKINKNSIQLRCSKRPLCKFTLSYNFKLKKFYKDAILNKNYFKLPKFFKFPMEIVLEAIRLYYQRAYSLRQIQSELSIRFPNYTTPSHVSILKWANKCSYLLSLAFLNKHFSTSNSWLVWLNDDTVIKINGNKYYLIVVMDYHTKVILSWFLSPTKDAQAVAYTLNMARSLTNSTPDIIVSDHAENIKLAINNTFRNSVIHIQNYLYQKSQISTNKLERFFSSIKSNFYNRKSFKSSLSATAFLTAFIIKHNLTMLPIMLKQFYQTKLPLVRTILCMLINKPIFYKSMSKIFH